MSSTRPLCLALAVCLMLALIGCGSQKEVLTYGYQTKDTAVLTLENDLTCDVQIEDMQQVAESKRLMLFANMETAAFAVVDKSNYRIYRSNPEHPEEDEAAQGVYKNWLKSQILVHDVLKASKTFKTKNSYLASYSRGGVTVARIEGGIQVSYHFPQEDYTIPVEFRLLDDSFVAEVDVENIRENGEEVIMGVSLLPMFGCTDTDDGYFLLANGSGALVHFDQPKTYASSYHAKIYGADPAFVSESVKNLQENYSLPVFGIQNGGAALFAVCEEGDANGYVNAAAKGQYTGSSFAYFEYDLRSYQTILVGDKTSSDSKNVVTFEKGDIQNGNIRVRYFLLNESESGTAGMAAVYRQYLIKTQGLTPAVGEKVPLYLSVLAAAKRQTSILGIRVDRVEAMTTYRQAADMVTDLHSNGVESVELLLEEWSREQLDGKITAAFDPAGQLGSGQEFHSLLEQLKEAGGLTLTGEFISFTKGSSFASKNADSIKDVNGGSIVQKKFKINTLYPDSSQPDGRILNMSGIRKVFLNFTSSFQKAAPAKLSLGSLGNTLPTDFSAEGTRRYAAELCIRQLLADASPTTGLVGDNANAYALPYVTAVINLPARTTEFTIVDASVPFYQMVLHGVMPLVSRPLNKYGSPETEFLKCMETGMIPQYQVMHRQNANLKETQQSSYYAGTFSDWRDTIIKQYAAYLPVYETVANAYISDWEMMAPGIYKTTYDNDWAVVVNYTDEAYVCGESTVESMNFLLMREEGQ